MTSGAGEVEPLLWLLWDELVAESVVDPVPELPADGVVVVEEPLAADPELVAAEDGPEEATAARRVVEADVVAPIDPL